MSQGSKSHLASRFSRGTDDFDPDDECLTDFFNILEESEPSTSYPTNENDLTNKIKEIDKQLKKREEEDKSSLERHLGAIPEKE